MLPQVSGLALPAKVEWTSPTTKRIRHRPADHRLLNEELYRAHAARVPKRYHGQRSRHGLYYFSGTSAHVWHESGLEATTLRWLDMSEPIVAIASQPMTLIFADGSKHVPDYMALLADYRQVVYDVKPRRFMNEKALQQFARTLEVCEHVGWEYEVHSDVTPQFQVNIRWLSAFKHTNFYPGEDVAARAFTASITVPLTVRDAAEILCPGDLARGRSAMYHLVWIGVLSLDLEQPFSDATIVSGGRHGR